MEDKIMLGKLASGEIVFDRQNSHLREGVAAVNAVLVGSCLGLATRACRVQAVIEKVAEARPPSAA